MSEEAQAIKNEIDLIDKLSTNYEKLTGAGMSKETAISFLAKEYKRSIGDINDVLTKYKLPKFDVSTYINLFTLLMKFLSSYSFNNLCD